MILELDDVHTNYGESRALQGISLHLEAGETVCLLGRNGAGKSTTLKSILGITPPHRGHIRYAGHTITGQEPYRIARAGIALVPEDRRIFPGLTVRENLDIARYDRAGSTAQWSVERIFDTYPMLAALAHRDGSTLSGGEQQILAVTRALMIQPRVLLLDEPNEGLAPVLVQQIGTLIDDLAQHTTVLFTDQNVHFALRHARRAYILEKGKIVHAADSAVLMADETAQQRYLSVS